MGNIKWNRIKSFWVSFFYILRAYNEFALWGEIFKALIQSRDLFLSAVGFLLSMDTFKRLIYDEPLVCKRMTPEKI